MAATSNGPVSSMPGSFHDLPVNCMCDEHPTVPAVIRIQGETDSFGCEYYDLCQECLNEHRAQKNLLCSGKCEWCKKEKPRLREHRDYEEGFYGRLYRVCDDCIDSESKRVNEELDDVRHLALDDFDHDYY